MTSTTTIAIVDDDALMRSGIGDLLRSAGLAVAEFASAQALLRSDAHFACIVSDIQMPGTDGLQLQRELLARGSKVPILFFTGFSDAALRDRALRDGAAAFLTKDCAPAELIAAIEAAIRSGSGSGG